MKAYLAHLKKSPWRLTIIVLVLLVNLLAFYYLFIADGLGNIWLNIGIQAFLLLVLYLLNLQKWREFNGWEGLTGRN